MGLIKEKNSIRVGGVDQNGIPATTATFSSDPIEFVSNKPWQLNVWFDANYQFVTTAPTISIEVSNVADSESFRGLSTSDNKTLPESFNSDHSRFKYWRIIYNPQGAAAGLVYFDLNKLL